MKKILLTIILGIFLISLASAADCKKTEGCIGTFSQLSDVEIYQTCNNCTYCNFTNVRNNKNSDIFNNIEATQDGSRFTYLIDKGNFSEYGLGQYDYDYECGNGNDKATGTLWFLITPSGASGNAQIVFHLFLIIMVYGVTFIGFFYGRNIPITVLGGMAMMFLGVYLVNSGLIIFRDNLVIQFAYLTIGLGFIMTFWALFEQFEVI